ncbi:aliphatic nitrilase [Bosea sp. CRIB-10]|uniref:carbon-nitrogen hydrolase family protein n=1 Tax=Bosea sp. CRIB-10 TaxID=378404 RepID=UPI0008E12A60|nr:carbon-nitrogen hydrolase family protein [Bosea sp. CRIB-10]SFD52313.1 aliphatic nitrilase [Bosea sp. CRIB-10]
MTRKKVAAAQFAPVYLDRSATTEKSVAIIGQAAAAGASLVVFPETFLPAYPYWTLAIDPFHARQTYYPRLFDQSVELGDDTTQKLRQAARDNGMVVVMGLTEREGGTLYNSQLVIDADGEILGCRRKLMPTHHERMSYGFGSGEDLRVFDTAVGKLGALVCFEHSNPLFRYAIQAQGEAIHVANWPGGLPWTNDIIDASVRQYAFEAQCFVVSVTSALSQEFIDEMGEAAGRIFQAGGGVSSIVAPGGKVLARSESGGEELIVAELDMAEIGRWKQMVDSFGHYARPDVVRLHVNTAKPSPITLGHASF